MKKSSKIPTEVSAAIHLTGIKEMSIKKPFKSPFYFIGILTLTLCIAEIIAVFAVPYFGVTNLFTQVLLNATIAIVFIFPSLYFFALKPLLYLIHRHTIMEEMLTAYKLDLEKEVKNRTADLGSANKKLRLQISERINAEKKIKKLSAAVEQCSVSIIITDLKGTIEYTNPNFTKITGYTQKEVIGQNTSLLRSGFQDHSFYKNLWDTIKHGDVWHGNFQNKKKSGEIIWERASIAPIKDDNGKTTNFVAIKEDTTENKRMVDALKESEIKFRSVTQSANDAIISSDFKGDIVSWNLGAEKIFQYKEEEILGKPLTILMPEKYRFLHTQALEKLTAGDKPHLIGKTTEIEGLRKNNSIFSLEISISRWKRGDEEFYSGVIRDISERKRVERLREDTERIVKHDLKSPLTSIIGFSDFLLDEDSLLEENQKDLVSIIQKNGYKMLHMINNSLDLFKMEEGTYPFEPKECNLISILKNISEEFIHMQKTKDIETIYLAEGNDINWDKSCLIWGEGIHLDGLFANLLKNAIEASPSHGEVTVSIKENVYLQNTQKRFHQIDIHNDGIIPKEVVGNFFGRYSTTGKNKGTGIGTYSALLIAKVHGGNITYTTSEENGTTLSVCLPAKSNTPSI